MSRCFKITRQSPEMISPARLTPREVKPLSDIDDQDLHRVPISGIIFYRANDTLRNEDPMKVIRAALAETLVPYYPFAGRMKGLPGGKLAVDCTGEGVAFVEADADVTLEEYQEEIQPPFPCLEELLCHFFSGILHSPLLQIQVTRFRCGGFTFGHCVNHTMADALGVAQFLKAVAEIAKGASAPSVTPVWMRELLNARNPPKVTCVHYEYDHISDTDDGIYPMDFVKNMINTTDMVQKSFFFGPEEISALRNSLPPDLRLNCSSFDVIAACLWRCRTVALQLDSDQEVRFNPAVNARFCGFDPPLPEGYYGNAIACPATATTAGKLIDSPLSYAVEQVRKAKSQVTEEYMKSLADLIVLKGRSKGGPTFTKDYTGYYWASDLRRIGFDEIDFGWGKPAYSGPAIADTDILNVGIAFFIPKKNKEGVKGMVVPMCFPEAAMERFRKEIEMMVKPKSSF